VSLAIDAVVLDMDGLLIDTEPVWRVAEVEVFATLGIELTEEDLLGSTGQTTSGFVAAIRGREPRPASGADPTPDAEVGNRIVDRVAEHVRCRGVPMAGVAEALGMLRSLGLPVAIASSSPPRLIDAVCSRLGLDDIRVRCSAEEEARGKPAADVYLTAARRLGVSSGRCLAFEDSPSGVIAAKTAGMRCIAIPDPLLAGDPAYSRADLVLGSLLELDERVMCRVGWES